MTDTKHFGKKAISLVVILVFAVMAVFPIAASGKFVSAQYTTSGCNKTATVVAVFSGDVPVYADSNLSVLILTIKGSTSGKKLQKYLVCSTDLTEDVLQIDIAGSLVYVANPEVFLPRAAADPK